MDRKILKLSLILGGIYFLLMAIAHAISLKIPGLFIYFNVSSHSYQDKIISALSFGWAVFFFTASSTLSRKLIISIILASTAALAMLTLINCTTPFKSISEQIDPSLFHLETALLGIYWLWVLIWYNRIKDKLNL